jgi:hypothetical protein
MRNVHEYLSRFLHSGELLNADDDPDEEEGERYGSRSVSRASLYADNDDLTVPLDALDAPGFMEKYQKRYRGLPLCHPVQRG